MSVKDWTPEQRAEMARKSWETRRKNAEAKKAAALESDEPETFDTPEIVYGEADTEEPAQTFDEPETPFDLFLAGLNRETREALSVDELRAVFLEEVAKAKAEKKASLKKVAASQAKESARMAAGLIPQATREDIEWKRRQGELVRARIELPPSGDQGEVPDIGLRIDQRVYLHGHTYTFTRSQWDSYRDQLYRVGVQELTFKGQNTRQRQWMMGRAGGTVNTHVDLNPDGSLA
jgi:hypothetical protein